MRLGCNKCGEKFDVEDESLIGEFTFRKVNMIFCTKCSDEINDEIIEFWMNKKTKRE